MNLRKNGPETGFEHEQTEIHWKKYTVGVMGSSSNTNLEALSNGYQVGRILAEMGYDVANGGYAVGGMGKTAEGFQDACREKGFSDEEVGKHFHTVVLSEQATGAKFAQSRKYIQPATRENYDDFASRGGGIINQSDAVIALPGGIGTGIETNTSAMGEWARQLKTGEGEGRPYIRPIIIIDSKNTVVKDMALYESESPGTINTVSDDVFVLAGHKLENGEVATLENDPQMREELKMILEYYQLIKDPTALGMNQEAQARVREIAEYVNKDMNRFVLLKDVVEKKKHVFGNLGEDWGT